MKRVVRYNVAFVDKNVRAWYAGNNEAIPLFYIKPLHSPCMVDFFIGLLTAGAARRALQSFNQPAHLVGKTIDQGMKRGRAAVVSAFLLHGWGFQGLLGASGLGVWLLHVN